jgi:alpha-amylase
LRPLNHPPLPPSPPTPQDGHRQRTINWIDQTGGTAAAFDFTTKGILQEALGRSELWRLVDAQGRPPGMLGMW